jgi:hypothetical protein
MLKWMLAAGAAALAIASPVSAEKGGHGGKGQGGQKAQVERGGHGGGQKQAKSNRGGGGDRQIRTSQGGGNRQLHARGGGGKQEMRSAHVNRGSDKARQTRFVQDDNRGRGRGQSSQHAKIEHRGGDKASMARMDDHRRQGKEMVEFGRGRGKDVVGADVRGKRVVDVSGDRVFRVRDVDHGVVRVRDVDRDELFGRRLGYGVGGCPPGLAKKPVACVPPGQAARFVGQPLVVASRYGALAPLPLSMRSLYYDDDDYYYRWGGGYVYRVDRDDALIASMIPLFGAALIGQPLSANYINPYYTPPYFNAFYPNSPYDCYQNGYGYVYETDCMTGLVEDVIPTYGYGYGVGQLMPASYSYYNVPYAYRPYFVDNNDYYYRYAPGAIYQVDRGTALISAVAALLTGGLTVGQPLPVGYSAYNVPLAYRSTYFDTPDMWYRYDNGYIYGINPQTRVVSNVAYVIV